MSFLKAEWRKLILINYEVDPEILLPYLPARTELDLYKDKCLISVVGFMFLNTRILGMRIPFHTHFEEVNLRFYVKHKTENGSWRRGVVFIKEIVPKRAITAVANNLYKEHYESCKMNHDWNTTGEQLTVSYQWEKQKRWHNIEITARNTPLKIDPESDAGFITEHYWGYTRINTTKTFEYEVTHPVWDIYPIINHDIDVDFGLVYGPEFSFLNASNPHSIMLAEGSEITVEKARRI